MSWAAVAGFGADLVGGYISGKKADKAANALDIKAQELSDEAIAAGGPKDVNGMLGGVSFDDDGNATQTFSPVVQSYFDTQSDRLGGYGQQLADMGTGEEAATRFYEQQRSMFGQKALNDRLRAENRLRQKGGSTTESAQMMGQFDYQQMMADQKMQVDSWDKSQNYIDKTLDRESSAFGNIVNAGSLPDKAIEQGMALGTMAGNNAWKAAQMKMGGAETVQGANAGFWGGIGDSISGADWGGMLSAPSGVGAPGDQWSPGSNMSAWGSQSEYDFDQNFYS